MPLSTSATCKYLRGTAARTAKEQKAIISYNASQHYSTRNGDYRYVLSSNTWGEAHAHLQQSGPGCRQQPPCNQTTVVNLMLMTLRSCSQARLPGELYTYRALPSRAVGVLCSLTVVSYQSALQRRSWLLTAITREESKPSSSKPANAATECETDGVLVVRICLDKMSDHGRP